MKTRGRHRGSRRTLLSRWGLRGALVATAGTIGLVASGVVLSPAQADAPTKVGWWSAGGSGASTTAPDTPTGGMRVSVAPQKGVVSYGALQYAVPIDGTATLQLTVTQSSPTPPTPSGSPVTFTPLGSIEACPTKTLDWKAGDNQDIATAPAYDCDTFHFAGAPSSDGKTMSFLLDGAADTTPGTLSLAIVPVTTSSLYTAGTDVGTDATPPYFVDFDKPAATSLQVDLAAAPPPTDNPPPSNTGGGTTTTTTGGSTTPSSGGSVPSVGLPSTTSTGSDVTGQVPVVAGQTPTTNSGAVAPVAATKPASTGQDRRDLLLVLLILVLFGILYTQNAAQQRTPRVLAGPRSAGPLPTGAVAPDAGATGAHAGAMAAYLPFMPSRGLGRFAKPRTAPARPLL
jgi:hypothetical protein